MSNHQNRQMLAMVGELVWKSMNLWILASRYSSLPLLYTIAVWTNMNTILDSSLKPYSCNTLQNVTAKESLRTLLFDSVVTQSMVTSRLRLLWLPLSCAKVVFRKYMCILSHVSMPMSKLRKFADVHATHQGRQSAS